MRETTLMAQPFDVSRLATAGDAVPIAENVGRIGIAAYGLFSASEAGLLVHHSGSDAGRRKLALLDRSGKQLSLLPGEADYSYLSLSPDGKTLAVRISDSANG